MSLYYVMRPDNAQDPDAFFTRVGAATRDLARAVKLAHGHYGRVYETNAHGNRLITSYFEPKPASFRPSRQGRRVFAETQLFGAQL